MLSPHPSLIALLHQDPELGAQPSRDLANIKAGSTLEDLPTHFPKDHASLWQFLKKG